MSLDVGPPGSADGAVARETETERETEEDSERQALSRSLSLSAMEPRSDEMDFVWPGEGKLGIVLEDSQSMGGPVLASVDCPDKPALRAGMVLVAVQGEFVEGLPLPRRVRARA